MAFNSNFLNREQFIAAFNTKNLPAGIGYEELRAIADALSVLMNVNANDADLQGRLVIAEASLAKVTNLGAFVANDKYVIVAADGTFHKSALGPAS